MSRSLWLLVLLCISPSLQQSAPLSPCPNVFQYEPPGSEPGRWYGSVNLSTDSTLHSLWLNVVLDSKADILGNWIGDVTTTDNIDFKIENTQMKIQPGPATAVRFFVQYNLLNKIPRLQAIRLNGREICNANNPLPAVDRPDSDGLSGGSSTRRPEISVSRPQERPQERPQSSRPSDSRPQTRPSDSRPSAVDGTVTRPVQGRPGGSDNGPVYTPTQNPPIDQSNANPYSISNQSPSQSVGTQTGSRRPDNTHRVTTTARPRPRPGTGSGTGGGFEEDDFVDDSKPGNDDEYFPGGLVTIVTGGGNSQNTNSGNNFYERPTHTQPNTCGKVVRNSNPNPLVVNGKPTLEGQWPWQIALYQTQTVDNKYICGGTLVSNKHIITAAHCVTRKGSSRLVNKATLTVYLGKHNLRTSVEGVQIRLVGEIRVHPQYNASSFGSDLSILHLREPIQYTDWVRPACLWPESQTDLSNVIGKKGAVVGWGFDDKGVATEELTLVEMPVVDQETCIRSYSDFFARFTSEYTFCAGYRDGVINKRTGTRESTSVCNGDSGGGMVFQMQGAWYLRGLVSLSVARQNEYRCDPTHYVVFTDLAKFLPWINQNVNDY